MKKPFSERALGRFLLGRGFYAALAACVLGAGASAWAIVDRTIDSITAEPSSPPQAASSAPAESSSPTKAVDQKVSDLPKAEPSLPSYSSKADAPVRPEPEPEPEPAVDAVLPVPELSAFLMPVNNVVFGQFSGDELVMDETLKKWHTHDGIDIRAEAGTPVLAVANGTVSAVIDDPMWGTVVEVSHDDGLLSRYCGLQPEPSVLAGQTVLVGDELGLVAETVLAETALESHLHFELYENGERVDPLLRMGFLESAD